MERSSEFSPPNAPRGPASLPNHLCWHRAMMAGTALAGIVFLSLLYRRVEHRAHISRPAAAAPDFIRIEAEVIRAPARLIRFAKDNPDLDSHDELVRRLRPAGLENVWFARTDRVYSKLREPGARTILLRAGQDPMNLGETLNVLATLAGHPPRHPLMDFSRARIVEIPEELVGMEPLKTLREMEDRELAGRKPRERRGRLATEKPTRLPESEDL